MTLDEIKAANEAADKQREAEASAAGMLDALNTPVVEAPVVDATPEQAAAAKEQANLEAAVKARQQLLVNSVKALVEGLVNDGNEFTVDELGWAVDAFKNLLTIRTTATEQHEAFSKVTRDAQDAFYSLKAKDLTVIPYEVSAGKAPAATEQASPASV